ncbi:LysR family transcriptional regulator [Nocardioides mangrovicus]|uniref:LysR family transcriptional regulator n=1 Tax=Nocardioides mangrovicus TaxID=2478913 RepID=A0A3L8P0D3_9ACTN|nr:LysR family transcriptional regulator [Nocardioides mangrovicus]RLV48377.1 LysR family transcriptional regulator [Nocardioides mangrovicus]
MHLLPDLGSLRLLADVARLGSIGAAGRAGGISQQSASERLRAMETQTGIALVHRSTGGSSLTPGGRLLVEWSSRLLSDADEVEHALLTLREDNVRRLRVFASMTTAEYLVPRWLVTLRRERGTLASLQAANSDLVLDALREDRADLGFVEGPADLAGLAHEVVGGDRLVLVASPDDPWAVRRRPVLPQELGNRALTTREAGSGTRRTVEEALAAATTTPTPPEVELTTNAAVIAAVRAGSPPAFVSELAASSDLAAGRLVAIPTAQIDLRRRFTAVWVGDTRPPRGPVRDLLGIALRR